MIDLPPLLTLIARDAFWAGVAAFGFALLFNVPPRALAGCALCGALGHALRRLLLENDLLTIELATLVGAAAVGFLSLILARRFRVPATLFSIPGVIPMVPGAFGFRAMLGFIQVATLGPTASTTLLVAATVNAIKAVLIVLAIVVGVAVPKLIFMRKRPVV